MSYDLVISSGRPDEMKHDKMWNASSGIARWVLRKIRDGVTDVELKAHVQEHLDGGYSLFAIPNLTEAQISQMIAVILGPLLPAARQKWTPDNDLYDVPALVEELVNETRDWLTAVNAQRRSEGRPELRPSLG